MTSEHSLTMHWDAGMIVLSYLVSVQASYTAINILQMRISFWLIAIAALCISVSGIWAMHFVGMAAMTMDADVTYDLGWTIASVFFAYVPMFGAFLLIDAAISGHGDGGGGLKALLFDKSVTNSSVGDSSSPRDHDGIGGGGKGNKGDTVQIIQVGGGGGSPQSNGTTPTNATTGGMESIADPTVVNAMIAAAAEGRRRGAVDNHDNDEHQQLYMSNSDSNTASDLAMQDTRDISIAAHIRAIKRAPHLTILLGGAMIALGACLMHYLGMHAMSVSGMKRTIDIGVVVASCFIAIFAGTAALYFAFVLPLTREYTIATGMVAGAAVSGMHYVGMYGIRFEPTEATMAHYQQMALSGANTTERGSSSLDPFVLYIIFFSSAISSASMALSSYFYRESLRNAADEAEERANLILSGKFDELAELEGMGSDGEGDMSDHPSARGPAGTTAAAIAAEKAATKELKRKRREEKRKKNSRVDPIMARLNRSNALLADQMQKLRSFLPPSLLAQFEAANGYGSLAGDDDEPDFYDDEGDMTISLGRSEVASSVATYQTANGGTSSMSTHNNNNNSTSFQGGRSGLSDLGGGGGGGPRLPQLAQLGSHNHHSSNFHEGPLGHRESFEASKASRSGGRSGSLRNLDIMGSREGQSGKLNPAANTRQQQQKSSSPMAGTALYRGGGGGGRYQYDMRLDNRYVAILALNCHRFNDLVLTNSLQLMSMYTHFMDGLCRVSKSQRGVLDIVHGDRVMMSFNASMRNASYARSCATAAVHIARDVGAPGLHGCMSVGIASGPARVGNIGCKSMMKYTICGNVVTNAVGAQNAAYELHTDYGVHVAGFVTDDMRLSVRTRALDIVQWKSMPQPAIISQIVGTIASEAADEWMYELQNTNVSDPFAKINAMFTEVLQRKSVDLDSFWDFAGGKQLNADALDRHNNNNTNGLTPINASGVNDDPTSATVPNPSIHSSHNLHSAFDVASSALRNDSIVGGISGGPPRVSVANFADVRSNSTSLNNNNTIVAVISASNNNGAGGGGRSPSRGNTNSHPIATFATVPSTALNTPHAHPLATTPRAVALGHAIPRQELETNGADTIVIPSLCFNCRSNARRTLREVILYTQETLRNRMSDFGIVEVGPTEGDALLSELYHAPDTFKYLH